MTERRGEFRRSRNAQRLFVAAYPTRDWVERALVDISKRALPEHRLTPPEQVHLTVQFIGDVAAADVEEAGISLQRACAGIGPFRLEAVSLRAFPPRGAARLLAIETTAPAEVMELHRRLAQRFSRATRRQPADRFVPHLTVCRFRREEPDFAGWQEEAELPAIEVASIRLVRSVLHPEGAEHRCLREVPLRAG